ncbi:MAG TPA: cytosine permease [Crinalium sp.]|jgi:NCS1 family nucleobase:cation symporter-1
MAIRVERVDLSLVENGVHPSEQTLPLWHLFWSQFTPNLIVSTWICGLLLPSLGLDLIRGLIAIVVGNLLGCLLPGIAAISGPISRLTQIESSRFALGKPGSRFVAFFNWASCTGWDAVNNVPAALAIATIAHFAGLPMPFWLALAICSISEAVISTYGHDLVQGVNRYIGYFLLASFAILGWLCLNQSSISLPETHAVSASSLIAGIVLIGSIGVAWSPYASDYSRYLPATTSPVAIATTVTLGFSLSGILCTGLGLLLATTITDVSAQGLIDRVVELGGGVAVLPLLAIALSSIASNSLNDNSASYCLMSMRPFGIRVNRVWAGVATGGLGYLMAVIGAGKYTTMYSNFIYFAACWTTIWAAIVIVHWLHWGKEGCDRYSLRWTSGATLFTVTMVASILLFGSSALYVSPVARWTGVDFSYVVGGIVAAIVYTLMCRSQRRRNRLATQTEVV